MAHSLSSMDEQKIDIFREIGNIGAARAAGALAGILDRPIRMSVPDVEIVPFNSIVNLMHGPETLVVGLLVDMKGDLNGFILMVLEVQEAKDMASLAIGEMDNSENLSELERSALEEIMNILVGSFLNAIGEMTGFSVRPAVPQLAVDMAGAIVSVATIEYGEIGDSVLFLKTQFFDVDKELGGQFFLIPDYKSCELLVKTLMGEA